MRSPYAVQNIDRLTFSSAAPDQSLPASVSPMTLRASSRAVRQSSRPLNLSRRTIAYPIRNLGNKSCHVLSCVTASKMQKHLRYIILDPRSLWRELQAAPGLLRRNATQLEILCDGSLIQPCCTHADKTLRDARLPFRQTRQRAFLFRCMT